MDLSLQQFRHSEWHRATSVAERLALLRAHAGIESDAESGAQHMRLWRRQSPFSIDGHFAQRLLTDGTTESEFRRLLGITAETLHVHADTPAWLTTLAAAYARSPVRRGDAAAASGTPGFQTRRFPERGRTAR